MTRSKKYSLFVSPLILLSIPALAQETETVDDTQFLEKVQVIGSRNVGAASTELTPELSLSNEEIMAYGAGSIEELLEELGPQISSNRGRGGGRPIILVNGIRVADFREIRSYPPEAIERVDVLPEEAALKYGYGADQRVMNFILKDNFSALTTEFEFGGPTQGEGFKTETDANYLNLRDGGRLSFEGEFETHAGILNTDRDISDAIENGRESLSAKTEDTKLGVSYNRRLDEDTTITISGNADFSESESLAGFDEEVFLLPSSSPYNTTGDDISFERQIGVPGELRRQSDSMDLAAYFTLVREFEDWRLTSTSKIERTESDGETDRTPDTTAFQQALDAGAVGQDANIFPYLTYRIEETSRISNSASTNLLLNGKLFDLPAGGVTSGLSLDLNHTDRTSETRLDGDLTRTELDRQIFKFQGSFDVPLISEEQGISGIDKLSLNLTSHVAHYSDFGELYGVDGTLSWTPAEKIKFLASYTLEQGAPGMAQLGDTISTNPNTDIFDYTRGESVEVTQIAGGNQDLQSDTRQVWKIGGEFRPFGEDGPTLKANYIDSQIDDPIGSFPSVDAATEAAFPDRFVRDANGNLITVDLRPVNFVEESRRDFEWNIFYRKVFEKKEPKAPEGNSRSEEQGASGRGGRSGGGGGRPGMGKPQTQPPSMYVFLGHQWHLEDKRVLAEGLAPQDYLNGDAFGLNGGKPEHQLFVFGGYRYKTFGVRLRGSWSSGTEVLSGSDGEVLEFSDVTSLDLRLTYTPDNSSWLTKQAAWTEGVRFSFEVENLLDDVVIVRDNNGDAPLRYETDRMDPVGRAVYVSIRKQF